MSCFTGVDASSAFDRVWHAGLLYKLNQKGVTGPLFLQLQFYLKNRKQRVVIKGQTSDWKDVAAGDPQGSILGPLLFLVYMLMTLLRTYKQIYTCLRMTPHLQNISVIQSHHSKN